MAFEMNAFRATMAVAFLLAVALFMFNGNSEQQLLRRDKRAPASTWSPGYPDQCVKQGQIAVTYAEGPAEGITINVIDQLKYIGGKGVKASFFPVAGFLNDVVLSTSLKYAQQQGHIVGFRFPTGVDPRTLSDDDLKATMCYSATKVANAVDNKGKFPKYVMMPFGQIDQRVDLIVRKMGFQPVSWNIDSNDYATTSSDCTAIPNAYKDQFSRLPAGWGKFIALQHDIVRCSLSTIDQVYNMIAAFNYTAVPMDTCLGDSTAYLDSLDCSGVSLTDNTDTTTGSGSTGSGSTGSGSTGSGSGSSGSPSTPSTPSTGSTGSGSGSSASTPKPSGAASTGVSMMLAVICAVAVAAFSRLL